MQQGRTRIRVPCPSIHHRESIVIKQNRSLSRGLSILRVFNDEPRPTLARIAASVELDKTTCRRFLLTLQEEGYV